MTPHASQPMSLSVSADRVSAVRFRGGVPAVLPKCTSNEARVTIGPGHDDTVWFPGCRYAGRGIHYGAEGVSTAHPAPRPAPGLPEDSACMAMDVEIELRVPSLTQPKDGDSPKKVINNTAVRFRKVINVPAFPQ